VNPQQGQDLHDRVSLDEVDLGFGTHPRRQAPDACSCWRGGAPCSPRGPSKWWSRRRGARAYGREAVHGGVRRLQRARGRDGRGARSRGSRALVSVHCAEEDGHGRACPDARVVVTAPVSGPTVEGAADARDVRPSRAERRGHRIDWATRLRRVWGFDARGFTYPPRREAAPLRAVGARAVHGQQRGRSAGRVHGACAMRFRTDRSRQGRTVHASERCRETVVSSSCAVVGDRVVTPAVQTSR